VETLARFVEPTQEIVSVAAEPEEKMPCVAAVRQLPDKAGKKMTVGARHRFLRGRFFGSKSHL